MKVQQGEHVIEADLRADGDVVRIASGTNEYEMVADCSMSVHGEGYAQYFAGPRINLGIVDIPLFKRQREVLNDVILDERAIDQDTGCGTERAELLEGLQELCDRLYDQLVPPGGPDGSK